MEVQKDFDKFGKDGANLLTSDELLHYWPKIRESLESLRHTWEDRYTIDDILNSALEGKLQVWAIGEDVVKLVLFTQVVMTPLGRELNILWCCGQDLDEYIDYIDAVFEDFAKVQGCKEVRIVAARPGWERKLKGLGYSKQWVVLSRSIKGRTH